MNIQQINTSLKSVFSKSWEMIWLPPSIYKILILLNSFHFQWMLKYNTILITVRNSSYLTKVLIVCFPFPGPQWFHKISNILKMYFKDVSLKNQIMHCYCMTWVNVIRHVPQSRISECHVQKFHWSTLNNSLAFLLFASFTWIVETPHIHCCLLPLAVTS